MREKLSMDFAWRFHADNLENPQPVEMMYYYHHSKAESGCGPAAPSFYDLDWQIVDLPHDYAVDSEPDFSYTNAHGFNRRYNAWYRRLFKLDSSDEGKRIILQFDGVATHCTVWVNGHIMHRNFCGYTSFYIDITEVVEYGDMYNQISVYVDTSAFEGWWYEGAGIYRHVWMIKSSDVCVENWGTFVIPRQKDRMHWEVDIETTLRSIDYTDRSISLVSQLISPDGCVISEYRQNETVPARAVIKANTRINVENPMLWSIEEPNLYKLRSLVLEKDVEIDKYDTTFGFRTLEYRENALLLNGKQIKLKGVCSHEDHANLGVAIPDDIREERMKMLKSIGCNAYRCSHNPPAPETLEICDRIGMIVIDETRWFDSSVQGLRHLESMIVRDRNHPSVAIWSMGNEEPLQSTKRGQRIMKSMVHFARKLDNTRPITIAMNGGLNKQYVTTLCDIIGVNYNEPTFDAIHKAYPGVPLISTEIGGKLSETGIMMDASGEDWEAVDTRPFFLGMFKWVAFGYRGESRAWPRLYSRSGIIEANGIPKENTWFYKQMWDDRDFIKIYPFHWNWDGKEGEHLSVKIYSNAEEVELYLNGKSQGRKVVNRYRRTEYSVVYERGELTAISYIGGNEVCRETIGTTGSPEKIKLEASRDTLRANRTDVITITATVVDSDGNTALWAKNNIRFQLPGLPTSWPLTTVILMKRLVLRYPKENCTMGFVR